MKRILFIVPLAFFLGAIFYSFTVDTAGDPWEVPAKYDKMENPIKGDKSSLTVGKMLYKKHCASCHGKQGLGDGPKAAQLDTPSGDFSVDLTPQTDGALFYKTIEGRGDMPGYRKKFPDDEDVWAMVNYMRTFEE